MPEMYPTSYNSLYKTEQLPRWHKFKAENMVANVMPPNSEKGKNNYMKSLRQLHREGAITVMHPDYDDRELAILVPGKRFIMLNPRTGEREPVSLHEEVVASATASATAHPLPRHSSEEVVIIELKAPAPSTLSKKRRTIASSSSLCSSTGSSSSDSGDDVVFIKTQHAEGGKRRKPTTKRKMKRF